jgi:AhpD family alkylhydroperoxidase
MQVRANFEKDSPEAIKALMALEMSIRKFPIERSLIELINLRTSQINGCAFCVDLHTSDARKAGEDERRLSGVVAWRETPFFTPRERAALAWTEALTLVSENRVPDELYDELSVHFDRKDLVELSVAITTINTWNRLGVAFRKMPKND